MSTFADILTQSVESIEAPKPLPVGTWTLTAISASYKEAQSADQKDVVLFGYTPAEPQEDVDMDGVSDDDWRGAKLWFRFYVETKNDAFGLRRHLEKHGIDMSGGLTFEEAFKSISKTKPQVYAQVGVRTYTNSVGDVVTENTLKGFAPVE